MDTIQKVSELTVEELRELIRTTVREVLDEKGAVHPSELKRRNPQYAILEIPPLSVGPWPEGLNLISREEMYGDDGR